MHEIQYGLPSPGLEAAQTLSPIYPSCQIGRRRSRHFLVGSREDAQAIINRLHLLGYAEYFEWSHVIEIPENGLVIRPDPGDVLRYLQRYRLPNQ